MFATPLRPAPLASTETILRHGRCLNLQTASSHHQSTQLLSVRYCHPDETLQNTQWTLSCKNLSPTIAAKTSQGMHFLYRFIFLPSHEMKTHALIYAFFFLARMDKRMEDRAIYFKKPASRDRTTRETAACFSGTLSKLLRAVTSTLDSTLICMATLLSSSPTHENQAFSTLPPSTWPTPTQEICTTSGIWNLFTAGQTVVLDIRVPDTRTTTLKDEPFHTLAQVPICNKKSREDWHTIGKNMVPNRGTRHPATSRRALNGGRTGSVSSALRYLVANQKQPTKFAQTKIGWLRRVYVFLLHITQNVAQPLFSFFFLPFGN